jgi:hypothetical protein
MYAAAATGIIAIGTPLVWLGTLAYGWGSAATRFAFRHRNLTATGLVVAGLASYHACHHSHLVEEHVAKTYTWTIERLRDERISTLERQLSAQRLQLETAREYASRPQQRADDAHIVDERTIAALQTHTSEQQQAIGRLENLLRRDGPAAQGVEHESGQYKVEPSFMERQGYGFHYVSYGETLSAIARAVGNDERLHGRIASENGISNPRKLLTGQLLEIPLEICTRSATTIYTRVPRLNSVVLGGDTRISEAFPDNWQRVLALNNALGLTYKDKFPIRHGSRIVYYE